MIKTIIRSLAAVGGVVLMGWGIAALVSFAQAPGIWTEPTTAPPGGNTPTPLNVGPVPQTKDAGLWINLGGAPTGFIVDQGNVGIGSQTPNSKLVVVGEGDFSNNRIKGVATPIDGLDAVNKDYVDARAGGGGSIVIYYRTVSSAPAPTSSCPSGWAAVPGFNPGYGPHYLGLLVYDWVQQGVAGSGGFAPGYTSPTIDGANYRYAPKGVAIGSDSVCSQDQTSVVYFSNLYNNQLTNGFTSMQANACFTDPTTGVTECNRCIVCQK